jgi:hypothetical protein
MLSSHTIYWICDIYKYIQVAIYRMADMTYRMNDGRLALVMVIVTHVVV